MSEIINQCCYTHKGAWTAVAQKGDFDQKYIGELSRHATLPGPEYGTDLAVFETVGDGEKFLIMRTQYGLRDLSTESGRASMFSHGYLLDTSGPMLDPNVFLTVSEDNFCTDELEASKNTISLKRTENFTLKTAMAVSGLTIESFSKLIKCVYQLAVRSVNKQALFIRAKDNKQSLALLYCIYSALIPRYSKFLSSASAEYNFSDMRNIVFTQTVNASRKYFIPETGENNVLSVNVEKNIDSLYFVDYGVKNFSTTEAIQEYYSEFEKTLQVISDTKQIDDDVMRLAHVMTADPMPSKSSDVVSDDEALMSVLKLAAEFNEEKQNEHVKHYIEKLREEAKRRGLIKVEPPKPFTSDVGLIDDNQFEDIGNPSDDTSGSVSYPAYSSGGEDIPLYRSSSQIKPPVIDANRTRHLSSSGAPSDYSFERNYANGMNYTYGNRPVESRSRYESRAFSDSEKRRFENDLQRCARRGTAGLVDFDRVVEQAVKDIGYVLDELLRRDLSRIIYNKFIDLVSMSVQNSQTAFIDNPLKFVEKWFSALGYGYAEISQIKSKIIATYWTKFQWQSFSLTKVKEYMFFAVDRNENAYLSSKESDLAEKADVVVDLSTLITHTPQCKAEEWLSILNGICLKAGFSSADIKYLSGIISPFYLKNIASKRNVKDIYSERFCVKYIVLFAMHYRKEESDCIMHAWQLIYTYANGLQEKKDINDTKRVIKSIEEITSIDYRSSSYLDFVFNSTNALFQELESRHITIPFDFWLALGSANTDKDTNEVHQFGLFYEYEYEPLVKAMSPAEIVSSSILLKNQKYVDILLDVEANMTKDKFIKNLVKAVSGDNGGSISGKVKSLFGRRKNNDS